MKHEVRKAVIDLIATGMGPQAVYDAVSRAHPEVEPARLAEQVRFVPTVEALQEHRTERIALWVLVPVLAAIHLLAAPGWGLAEVQQWIWPLVLGLGTLVLGAATLTGRGKAHLWLALFAGYGAVKSWAWNDQADLFDLRVVAGLLASLGVFVLAWFLHRNLYAEYTMEPDPQGKHRIVFQVDQGDAA